MTLFPLDQVGSLHDLQTGELWTPERLREEVSRRTARLTAAGVDEGARVLIRHAQAPSFFADLFAVFELRACAAILDAQSTAEERANILDFLKPRVELGGEGGELVRHDPQTSRALPEDAALLLFTSGSTGAPKGVVLTYAGLRARLGLNVRAVGAHTLRNTLCFLPTHFGHGLIGNSLTPLSCGGNLLLTKFSTPLAQRLAHVIRDNGITFVSSVPTMWRTIFERSEVALTEFEHQLERVHIGSAPLSAEVWSSVCAWTGIDDVVNTYGITEASNWISGASAKDGEPRDGWIGRSWGGRFAVRSADGALRSSGSGELLVASPSLMQGYLDRDDLTREVLDEGWFRTGDLGAIDEAGEVFLSGRAKNEINRGGAKVQPEDVDLVLERHPRVAEACTFALPDERLGERVATAIRQLDGSQLTEEELIAWCAASLRKHAIPEDWFLLEDIPKTDRGKVLRGAVRDYCLTLRGSSDGS